jgi:ribonuclease HII
MAVLDRGQLEQQLHSGNRRILGVDEVGRGCLAGPVYAAATVLDYLRLNALDDKQLAMIRDSKTLSCKQRRRALEIISNVAIETHTGIGTVEEIDEFGIIGATFLAMKRAISQVKSQVDIVLVDGNQCIPDLQYEQMSVVKGDNLCYAIAAASIIAKEARDLLMQEMATLFPGYGFENHVGYGTKQHLEQIAKQGITPMHRKSFAPIQRQIALCSL